MIEVTKSILKSIYKPRPREARKYDYGLLLIIGGSDFYSGSPALSAMAAWASGVDMVRILAPKRAADIIASFSPNLAALPLIGKYLDREDLATILSQTKSAEIASPKKVAAVIGGGAGRSEETQEVILEYLSQISIPVVIDADAIYAVAKKPEVITGKNFLITPHLYEFYVLTNKKVDELSQEDRIRTVKEEAARLKTTILLKGAIDIISDGKEVALNTTGCGFMTKGGMGDTLAGIAGALMSRGINVFEAAQAAVYINGLAGELASKKLKESVTATDLIKAIPDAIK